MILVSIKPDLKTNYPHRDQRASEKKVRALFNPIPSLKSFETTPDSQSCPTQSLSSTPVPPEPCKTEPFASNRLTMNIVQIHTFLTS